jgi:5-hydroxyisourate hydrolase
VSVSISTHVLDTGAGKPAKGVNVQLFVAGDGFERCLASEWTDEDGRIARLVEDLEPGTYSLVFHPPSPFFTRVELQLDLADGHHHVPLLVSPYGCASYRGS